MKSVGAGAGNDVYHAARGASIFGGVTVGDDLEFLHGLLRHRRADAVHRIVDRIGSIDVDQIGASPLSAHVQPGGGCSPDRRRVITGQPRISEGEIDVVAAVDGQVVDALLRNCIGGGSALRLHQLSFRADGHYFLRAGDRKRDRQRPHLTDSDVLIFSFYAREAWSTNRKGVSTGRQRQQPVFSVDILGGRSLESFGLFARCHRGIGHDTAPLVPHKDVQVTGGGSLGGSECSQEQNQKRYRKDFHSRVHRSPRLATRAAGGRQKASSPNRLAGFEKNDHIGGQISIRWFLHQKARGSKLYR